MGGKQSKHNAFTNDLQLQPPPEDKDDTKCCLFCPIPKASPSSPDTTITPSRNSSKNNLSRPNSNTALYKDEFGTPLPDTPIFARRIRDAAFDDQDNEEKKTGGGGSFGRATGGSYVEGVSSSRYGGLEKETSTMFMNEKLGNGQKHTSSGGGGKNLPTAEIYEGPVSLLLLWLAVYILELSIFSLPLTFFVYSSFFRMQR